MNWNEYLVLSEKTMSTEFHCDIKEQRLLHSIIGMLTEIEELMDNYDEGKTFDPVNIVEEISDVTWYLAIIGREYDIKYPQLVVETKNSDPMGIILTLIKNSCKLLDMIKKKLYYNKPMDEDLFVLITKMIMLNISDYAHCYDINIEKSFDINIEKLKSRFGEKFSSENAIDRDLKKERSILEGK